MRQAIWILAVTIRFSGIGFAQTQDLILPVVLNGYVRPPIHYQTTIRIVNLLADPVQVTLNLTDTSGAAIPPQTITVTPKIIYSAGVECGGGGPQANLVIAADGTLAQH